MQNEAYIELLNIEFYYNLVPLLLLQNSVQNILRKIKKSSKVRKS